MKLLGGLGRSSPGALISFIKREGPQSRRSCIHVVPNRRHMAVTCRSGQRQPPSPAAGDTRWMVLLNRWCCATNSTAVDVVANTDAKTVAEAHTSRGQLRVSLSRAAPPAISFICFDWTRRGRRSEEGSGKSPDDDGSFSHAVVAAHGDSVLLRFSGDYFVYKVVAGQRPSLSLLPACHVPMYGWDRERGEYYSDEECRTEREFDYMDTGLLRCGGEDGGGRGFLVAQLQVAYEAPFDTAELCVLRDDWEWEFKEAVPIVHHEGGGRHDLGRWQDLNAAVPAGNRFLCWVSYNHSTLLVCDMAEVDENPKLRYVPLPVKAVPPPKEKYKWVYDEHEYLLHWLYYRRIGAVPPPPGTDDANTAAVRFVSIDRRCCCGAPVIRSACEHSGNAFTVTTWTLALRTTTTATGDDEPLTWVKEGVLDCEEFWALLAGFDKGLPRGAWPMCPVVSSENPDVVCFLVAECEDGETTKGKIWALEVDMRRKTLVSVVPLPPHPVRCVNYGNHLPAKLHSSTLL